MLWMFLLFLSAKKEQSFRDLRGIRSRRSYALAKRRLKAASRMMREGKRDEFYAEASKTVYGYFADRLGIPSQIVSAETIEEKSGDALPPSLFNEIRTLLEELSMGRFARVEKSADEMEKVYDMADHVLATFEKVKLK